MSCTNGHFSGQEFSEFISRAEQFHERMRRLINAAEAPHFYQIVGHLCYQISVSGEMVRSVVCFFFLADVDGKTCELLHDKPELQSVD